jgi:hypothetical protein
MNSYVDIIKDDLVGEPEKRLLVTGKRITSFNLKISDKTVNLNTGQKLRYEDKIYEIMNREYVNSKVDYLKFNCVFIVVDKEGS